MMENRFFSNPSIFYIFFNNKWAGEVLNRQILPMPSFWSLYFLEISIPLSKLAGMFVFWFFKFFCQAFSWFFHSKKDAVFQGVFCQVFFMVFEAFNFNFNFNFIFLEGIRVYCCCRKCKIYKTVNMFLFSTFQVSVFKGRLWSRS